jgi:hydrogenase-4 component B
MSLMLAGMALILAGGIAQFFVPEGKKGATTAAFAAAGGVPVILAAVLVIIRGEPSSIVIFGGTIAMDGLTAFFSIVIAVMSFASALYSVTYMRMYEGKSMSFASHYFFLPVLITSMLAVTVSRDALIFLFSWEIMALSSFFLVIFENEKKDVIEAGIYYLVMSHISVALLMAGFALAGGNGLSFEAMAASMKQSPGTAAAVFAIMFAGFCVKDRKSTRLNSSHDDLLW